MYTHYTTFERGKIEQLHKLGYSARLIAKHLASKIKKSTDKVYKAEDAQIDYYLSMVI